MEPVEEPPVGTRHSIVVAGVLVLLLVVAGLFYYKWTSSYATVSAVREAGAWTRSPDAVTTGGVLKTTLNYFGKVWIALVFGILIGAAVRAAVSPKVIVGLLGRGGMARRQMAGGLAGAPLMLCSCCVTPIFTGVYERGAKLGAALAVMLASPALNLAALVLTFTLFRLDLALVRLGAAMAAVFLLPALLERVFGSSLKPVGPLDDRAQDDGPRTFPEFLLRYVKGVGYLTVLTVPLIGAGVLLSSLILPLGLSTSSAGAVVTLLGVAAISVLVALPTFFEIPLALMFDAMGAPGAAAAMLIAGPMINLPSLFVLARETKALVSVTLAGGIWLLAVGGGLVAML